MQTVFDKAMAIKDEIAAELGIQISDDLAIDVFEHCKRKCDCAKKGIEYLPAMFRTELPIRLMIPVINSIGEINMILKEARKDVRHLRLQSMFSGVS